MKRIRYGSVCSGVQAATLAWKPLGWECVFVSQIQPFPCTVLQEKLNVSKPLNILDVHQIGISNEQKQKRKKWINEYKYLKDKYEIPNEGDFTKIGKKYEGKIDLLIGGTPCQDLSVAGKREGLEGKRSCLAIDFVRLAYQSKCKYFIWENVPGVFNSNQGRDFARLLSLFSGLKIEVPQNGFTSAGVICNGRRDRFGLAWRIIDARYTKSKGFQRGLPQRRKRVFVVGCFGDWTSAAQILFDTKGMSRDIKQSKGQKNINSKIFNIESNVANKELQLDIENNNLITSVIVHGAQTPIFNNSVANTLGCSNHGFQNCVCKPEKLQTSFITTQNSKEINKCFLTRKLTPIQCQRLMGFPDNWTRVSWKGKDQLQCPDELRYKACGNSFCVNVIRWLGQRIQKIQQLNCKF